ncbi:MAG: beta-eliminating lyase-related protein [Clostridiales bacterium]|nr:beta-eliminating lyase-related protein [Clostridiales bacterium]
MKIIDMRSDTVTKPTDAMRTAMASAQVGDDVYGDDCVTNELERLAAEMAGKEAAIFVPSGTFGNQLALFTHCRRGDEVIIYGDCHIAHDEAGAPAIIAGVQLQTLEGRGSLPNAVSIESRIRKDPSDFHYPPTGLICMETAHSDGRVIPLDSMAAVHKTAKRYGLPIHLDGARLFNAADYLGVKAAEITKYADSVMFCLSKGLCAPIGSMLAGTKDFVDLARRRRKIMGGGMRQTGILAAAGLIALRDMTGRLREDRDNAVLLANKLSKISGIACEPSDVHANLVFFALDGNISVDALMNALNENGILANPPEDGLMRLATHYWISEEDVQKVADVFAKHV